MTQNAYSSCLQCVSAHRRPLPPASCHRAVGLSRAAVERVVIKLEGQVELILFSPRYILVALRPETSANLF